MCCLVQILGYEMLCNVLETFYRKIRFISNICNIVI